MMCTLDERFTGGLFIKETITCGTQAFRAVMNWLLSVVHMECMWENGTYNGAPKWGNEKGVR